MDLQDSEKKLLLAFGGLLALLATACGLSVFSSSWLSSQADLIIVHPFTVSVAIRRIEADTVRMRLAMKEMVLADTPGEVDEAMSAMDKLDETVEGNLAVLKERYLGPDKDVEDLAFALKDWRPVRQAVANLARQGKREQAEALTRPGGAGGMHWAAVDRAVEVIAAYARNKATFFLGRSRDIRSNTVHLTLVSGLALTLAGCVIAMVVFRSLRRGRETFQATFEQAAVGMAHACVQGKWLMVNGKLCAMLGYDRKELLALSTAEVIHPDDRTKGAQSQELLKDGHIPMYAMEKRFLKKDGGVLWTDVTVSLATGTAEGRPYFIYVVQDISERKRVEYELEKARSFIRNIINSMPSVVIGVDSGGHITHLNHKAEGQLSLSASRAVGANLADYFPEYSSEMEAIRKAIAERRPVLKERMPQTVDGDIRYHDVLIYPLVANGVEGAVLRIDDVTERVRLTEMMVQTEKMMSVGGLAAGMAHEINNPLGAILQSAQVILMHLDPQHEPNKRAASECGCDMETIAAYMARRNVPLFLEAVREAGARAARIVSNMLEFSRRSESSKEPVSISEVLDRTVELASTDYDLKKKYDFRHIEIVKDYVTGLPPAFCSRTEIEQVALNILKNAAQAMASRPYESGGPRLELRTYAHENMVCFDIEDNGPGMEEGVRRRVFEPFFTTKQPGQGTGLGLSVSYFIVTNNHDGTITVDSAPGMGACFTVCLPLKYGGGGA